MRCQPPQAISHQLQNASCRQVIAFDGFTIPMCYSSVSDSTRYFWSCPHTVCSVLRLHSPLFSFHTGRVLPNTSKYMYLFSPSRLRLGCRKCLTFPARSAHVGGGVLQILNQIYDDFLARKQIETDTSVANEEAFRRALELTLEVRQSAPFLWERHPAQQAVERRRRRDQNNRGDAWRSFVGRLCGQRSP